MTHLHLFGTQADRFVDITCRGRISLGRYQRDLLKGVLQMSTKKRWMSITALASLVSVSHVATGANATETLATSFGVTIAEENDSASSLPDFDGDGTIGFGDFVLFAGAFGSSQGDKKYDARYDLNDDGEIGFADFVAFAQDFGKEAPPITDASDSQSSMLYWTDYNRRKIQRASLDGSNIQDLVPGLKRPVRLAIDTAGGKMYWTDSGTRKIQRANLDGSDVEDLVTTGLDYPNLALDVDAGKMYWTDSGTNRVQCANLDGSNVEDLVTGLDSPDELVLDAAHGRMYWTDSGTDKIQCADLDGSNVQDLVVNLSIPGELALDVVGGKMYWTEYGAEKIRRANLDGSNVEDLVIAGLRSPGYVALDAAAGKLYWADGTTGKVQRANLDGSEVQDLVDGLNRPGDLLLHVAGGGMCWTTSYRVRVVAGRFYWFEQRNAIHRANLDGTEVEKIVEGLGSVWDLELFVGGAGR